MKNTLFISDLDGTLLNSSCQISDKTAKIINSLISRGLTFTVATARTSETVRLLTKSISINAPAILMNGVVLYDLKEKRFISYEAFPEKSLTEFLNIIRSFGSKGFMYTISQNVLETHYVNLDTPNAREFMEERIKKFGKKFIKLPDFSLCISQGKVPVYFSVSDTKEKLLPVYEKLKRLAGFSIEFYRDIYNTDFWYLEVCSEKASKYNAACNLKKQLGFEKLVAFGDNLNDLPLFKAADESYAVENAKDEVKSAAASVIGSNDSDGVAQWLLKSYENALQSDKF